MVSRMGLRVDAVMAPGSLDAILAFGDAVRSGDSDPVAFLDGTVCSDGSGTYFRVDGVGGAGGGELGMVVVPDEPGLEPTDDILDEFRLLFDDGLLIILDPYACEFSPYRSDGDAVRGADIVVSE